MTIGRTLFVFSLFALWPVVGLAETKGAGEAKKPSPRERANAAYQEREYDLCGKLFEQAAQSASKRASINDYYNAACCYGRTSDVNKAFAMLRQSIDAGYNNLNHMKGDSDLEKLHSDPRWKALIETVKVPTIRITEKLATDAAQARFVYDDVRNFLTAMRIINAGADPVEVIEKEYLAKGTPGLEQFIIKYGLTPEAIASAMEKKPEEYGNLGERLVHLEQRESDFRTAYGAFKRLVPQAVFPPTYFLVSDYGGVASGSPAGQLITIERRTKDSIDRMETLLAHELVHFQQVRAMGPDAFYALFGEKKSLLGLTIREGAAEFIAQRLTGRITQQDALEYVLEHEKVIWSRFQPVMLGRDTRGWMWSKPNDPDQPRDIAYALGMRITEAYHNNASDKTTAMHDILSAVNYPAFLQKSGYEATLKRVGGTGN